MINIFDNNTSIDCARRMKEMGFFGDYILAVRRFPNTNQTIIRRALSVGWLKSSIARFPNYSRTPQGFHFWANIYRQL